MIVIRSGNVFYHGDIFVCVRGENSAKKIAGDFFTARSETLACAFIHDSVSNRKHRLQQFNDFLFVDSE